MSDIALRLGEAIKNARHGADLKQKELAAKLKVSVSHLCEIEKGKKTPSIELLESIEEHLGDVWVNR